MWHDLYIYVQYYNLNGKMPHITYEYTVPRAPELRVASPMASTPEQPQISNLMSKTSKDPSSAVQKVNASSTELFSTHNEIEARKEYGKKDNQSSSLVAQDNVEVHVGHEELLWGLQASVNFSELPGLVLFRPASEVLQNELDDEMHHLEAQSSFGKLFVGGNIWGSFVGISVCSHIRSAFHTGFGADMGKVYFSLICVKTVLLGGIFCQYETNIVHCTITYTAFQNFGSIRYILGLNVFERSLLCSPRMCLSKVFLCSCYSVSQYASELIVICYYCHCLIFFKKL